MVKFEADVYVKRLGVYSLSICNDALCFQIKEDHKWQKADKECGANSSFGCFCYVGPLLVGVQCGE